MGINNRQRRAAKAKQRAKRRTAHSPGPGLADETSSREFQVGAASLALRRLALHAADGWRPPAEFEQFARFPVEYQQLAVDDQLTGSLRGLIAGGWTPLDLYEVARRRQPEPLVDHLLSALASETARHSKSDVHPDWLAQLRDVTPAQGAARWARQHALDWVTARDLLIDLLALVFSLPKVEAVLPPPGSSGVRSSVTGIDERILQRVRGLLAKAESTEFEAEADAYTAKAQELMTAYSIERSLAEADSPRRAEPVVRRMWIDAPYVVGKATLVDKVADSNHCRCLISKEWGFVTLVGFAPDLDTVELLATSLLVQATRAMTLSGSHVTRSGTSRTRSFRHSFLVAYAQRIGERLRETATETEARADAAARGQLLPVLASRHEAVEDATVRMFPALARQSVRVSNLTGWGAGRAAADLARLNVRDALGGERAG